MDGTAAEACAIAGSTRGSSKMWQIVPLARHVGWHIAWDTSSRSTSLLLIPLAILRVPLSPLLALLLHILLLLPQRGKRIISGGLLLLLLLFPRCLLLRGPRLSPLHSHRQSPSSLV